MKKTSLTLCLALTGSLAFAAPDYLKPRPFGTETKEAMISDTLAIGEWWKPVDEKLNEIPRGREWRIAKRRMQWRKWIQTMSREEAMAFALYAHDNGVLKITGQCFPLLPDEPKTVVLEFKIGDEWQEVATQPVQYPGWSVHFRIEDWDNRRDVPYRLRLGSLSQFEGLVRRDPVEKDTIVLASMSCNSPNDKQHDTRTALSSNLLKHDPDVLFFAGDQNYTHEEATYGWLQFGMQFRDVMKDRPTICIPDDHDVGHANLWGESGKVSTGEGGAADGGYMFPASFVNMVERQQTWNLPDPYDPTPIQQDIGVYYTEMNVGGVSFAILEDRKFKSAPLGNIPVMGPRPDHIVDPAYDRSAVDLPGLKLLGDRQLAFLEDWGGDWTGDQMKVALSQTAFTGAVHIHGQETNRLLADLDCNGWPQTPRKNALRLLRQARASHICGDQHLAVSVQHGIDAYRDGPYSFTSPALVNTVYGRWWHPEDEQPGGGDPVGGPLPWVGDYEDGLGNKITMLAYANPKDRKVAEGRGDGYGIVRFHKPSGNTTFEAWPRFCDVSQGDSVQYAGWPITFNQSENEGRTAWGNLNEVTLPVENAVVELLDENGERVYCYRVKGPKFFPPVYEDGTYTLKAGRDRADTVLIQNAKPNR